MAEIDAIIVDALTGETIVRELTQDEIALSEQAQQDHHLRETETQARAAARESALAKLADLGLTAEEIAAL